MRENNDTVLVAIFSGGQLSDHLLFPPFLTRKHRLDYFRYIRQKQSEYPILTLLFTEMRTRLRELLTYRDRKSLMMRLTVINMIRICLIVPWIVDYILVLCFLFEVARMHILFVGCKGTDRFKIFFCGRACCYITLLLLLSRSCITAVSLGNYIYKNGEQCGQ